MLQGNSNRWKNNLPFRATLGRGSRPVPAGWFAPSPTCHRAHPEAWRLAHCSELRAHSLQELSPDFRGRLTPLAMPHGLRAEGQTSAHPNPLACSHH